MKRDRLLELREIYRRELLENVVPFWLHHSLDREQGGQFNSLDRDGSIFDTDKSMWLQGRALWMFAKLYNEVEARPEWLEAARHIYDFIMRHGFDSDGRMFFAVTADGRPLRKRRYVFTRPSPSSAWRNMPAQPATPGHWSGRWQLIAWWSITCAHPGKLAPKVYPETRRAKAHNVSMIMLATTQELRLAAQPDPLFEELVDEALDQILNPLSGRGGAGRL